MVNRLIYLGPSKSVFFAFPLRKTFLKETIFAQKGVAIAWAIIKSRALSFLRRNFSHDITEDYMQIPHTALGSQTLRSLIEEYITREGTDYGRESELEEKVKRVMAQLEKGKAHITFDAESETCTLITTQTLTSNASRLENQGDFDPNDVVYDQDA